MRTVLLTVTGLLNVTLRPLKMMAFVMRSVMLNTVMMTGASTVTSESENDDTPESAQPAARVARPSRPLIGYTSCHIFVLFCIFLKISSDGNTCVSFASCNVTPKMSKVVY